MAWRGDHACPSAAALPRLHAAPAGSQHVPTHPAPPADQAHVPKGMDLGEPAAVHDARWLLWVWYLFTAHAGLQHMSRQLSTSLIMLAPPCPR